MASGRAMVVTGHRAATEAGLRALRRGGSAADAAIAASAALSVVLGHATSVGGDCFLLFHSARTGRIGGINSSGRAPQAATPDRFSSGMAGTGAAAAVIPGLVMGWEALHRREGSLPWPALFEDAIDLAERGHPTSRMLAGALQAYREALLADPGCAQLYFRNGRPLAAGELLQQPALAESLRAIAEGGADEFYRGHIARRLASFCAGRGGLISREDLESFSAEMVEPVSTWHRGHEVFVMPPNSYGVLLLMQLHGLSVVEPEAMRDDVVVRLAAQMSAMKAAFEAGVSLIADPQCSPTAVDILLSARTTAAMQAAVKSAGAALAVPNVGGTSCVLVVDAGGNAVNVVQSTFHPFGSAARDPDTGILLNNRMLGFAHVPGKPNSVAPGKRPPHTLCPIMVKRHGRLRYVMASPGGLSQTLTGAQVLTQLLDCGRPVAEAVAQPRWCNTLSGEFLLEPEFSQSVAEGVAARGHLVHRRPDPYFYGSAKAIEVLASGELNGAADHRREACAAGY